MPIATPDAAPPIVEPNPCPMLSAVFKASAGPKFAVPETEHPV